MVQYLCIPCLEEESDMTVEQQLQYIIENMATKDDIANMATKDDIANMATKDDIYNSEKLLLNEMERLHNIYTKKFDRLSERMDIMQNEINATRYSNETVEILIKKVTELEKRIAELEKTA